MQFLTDASKQLFSRPDDEHFDSFEAIEASARASETQGEEVSLPAKEIIVLAREHDHPQGPYAVQLTDGRTVDPNHYSMTQLCQGAKVPMGLLERLTAKTGAQVLNESLQHDEVTDRRALLEHSVNGSYGGGGITTRLRAITSDSYYRVWDGDILADIKRHLLPMGFIPALPTINTDAQQRNILGNNKPALFRGDRDSFSFFYTEPATVNFDTTTGEMKREGPQDDDGLGGLRRGFMVGNSEVGARAAVYRSFYFRAMCSNFLIWDTSEVESRRQVHRGERNMRTWFLELRDTISRLSAEIGGEEMERFQRAAQQAFVRDGEGTDKNKALAAQRLNRQFRVPRSVATDVVDAALLPINQSEDKDKPDLSLWTVANGLTWEAKDTGHAVRLLELGNVGQDVLAMASV